MEKSWKKLQDSKKRNRLCFCFLNGGAHIVELIVTGQLDNWTTGHRTINAVLFIAEQKGSKDKCACVFLYRYICMREIFVYT